MIEHLADELKQNLNQIRELSRKDNPKMSGLWDRIEREMPELVKALKERERDEQR